VTDLANPRAAFLDELDDIDRYALSSSSRERTVAAGNLVFDEGDVADGVYVVRSGRVRIFRADTDGRDVELGEIGEGQLFGELALLEGGIRSASATAVETSRFLVIDRDAFIGLLTRQPAVALRVLAALSRLVRERTERVLRDEAARRELALEGEVERHRTLSQMVAGVAHELNTPLGTANTAADIVVKRLSSEPVAALMTDDRAARIAIEDAVEAAGLLQRNLERAHRLVMSFKQISVQQSTASLDTVDIGRVVSDTVDLFRIDARTAGITVEVEDGRSDSDVAWTGQPAYLTQVILNLLGNIQRYAYPDGVGGRVEVVLADARLAGEPAFSIVVRDHGAGIAAADLGRVFEPFFTTGRARGGSGLGLSIVKSLVTDALAGTIELESELGQGTTATVLVPVIRPEVPMG
jgi:signal transduction histidine kinase